MPMFVLSIILLKLKNVFFLVSVPFALSITAPTFLVYEFVPAPALDTLPISNHRYPLVLLRRMSLGVFPCATLPLCSHKIYASRMSEPWGHYAEKHHAGCCRDGGSGVRMSRRTQRKVWNLEFYFSQ